MKLQKFEMMINRKRCSACCAALLLIAACSPLLLMQAFSSLVAQKEQVPAPDPLDPGKPSDDQRLSTEQTSRANELIQQLSSPNEAARESALQELVMMPKGVATSIYESLGKGSNAAEHLKRWYLTNISQHDPVTLYLSRTSGQSPLEVRQLENDARTGYDTLSNLLGSKVLANDIRVFARLLRMTHKTAQVENVLQRLELAGEAVPAAALFREMLTNHANIRPERRAALMNVDQGKNIDQSLALLFEASTDRALPVLSARDSLVLRLREKLEQAAIVERFLNAKSRDEQMALLELVSLDDQSQEVRQAWLKAESALVDDELRQAFLGMACRESLSEVLQRHLGSAELDAELLELLSLLGTKSDWLSVLASKDHDDFERRKLALNYLRFSELTVSDQVTMLEGEIQLATASDSTGTSLTPSDLVRLLSGYTSPTINAFLISQVRAGSSEAAELLAQRFPALDEEARLLLTDLLPNTDDACRLQVLAWQKSSDATLGLRSLLWSSNPEVAHGAAHLLADWRLDLAGNFLAACRWHDGGLSRDHWQRLPRSEARLLERLLAQPSESLSSTENIVAMVTLALCGNPEFESALTNKALAPLDADKLLLLVATPGQAERVRHASRHRPDALLGSIGQSTLPPLLALQGYYNELLNALENATQLNALPVISVQSRALSGAVNNVEQWQNAFSEAASACTHTRSYLRLLQLLGRGKPAENLALRGILDGLAFAQRSERALPAYERLLQAAPGEFVDQISMLALTEPGLDAAGYQRINECLSSFSKRIDDEVEQLVMVATGGLGDLGYLTASPQPRIKTWALMMRAREGSHNALEAALFSRAGKPRSLGVYAHLLAPGSPRWSGVQGVPAGDWLALPEGVDPKQAWQFWYGTRHMWEWSSELQRFSYTSATPKPAKASEANADQPSESSDNQIPPGK